MAETPRLDLPYIAASQAQKEVVHNLSLDRLDLLCQCAVLDRNLTTPPGSPALGDAYIVAATGTGAWAGHDNELALWVSGQWQLIAPLPGFQCWVLDEAVLVYWSGTAWTIVTGGGGGATTFLGLTDTPDTYSGQAGKVVQVNAGGTALEFGTAGGGGGAPPDATYLVSTAHGSLSAERVITDSADVTWNLATAGQVQAIIPPGAITFAQIEDVLSGTLVGRSTLTTGPLESIGVGPGLELTGGILSATGGGSGGSSTFTGLSDTPDTYAGHAGELTVVNAGETALEFVTLEASEWTRVAGVAGSTAATGLLAFWRLEEASGTRVDSVASQALVPTGAPGSAAGKTGQAVSFDTGTGKYLTAADSTTLSVGANQDFTVACWVRFNGTPSGSRGLVGKGNASISYNNCEYLLGTSGTSLLWYIRSSNVNAGVTLAAGTWYLVLGWYDAAADLQYVQVNNGTPVSLANATGSFDSADPLEVGRQPQYTGSAAFDGLVDNVMFWKRVLTATERTDLWNGGAGRDYADLFPAPATLYPATSTDRVLAGATTLTATEPLESAGGLKLGPSTSTVEGVVRWTGTDMEVRKGGAWVSMTGQGLGTMAQQDASAVAITGGTAVGLTSLGVQTGTPVAALDNNSTTILRGNVSIGPTPDLSDRLFVDGNVRVLNYVGIGNLPRVDGRIALTYLRGTEWGLIVTPNADSGATGAAIFLNAAGAPVGSITTTASATAYNTSSDIRLKRNVQPLTGSLAVIAALNPVSHRWNIDDSYAENFLAHELQRVLAYAVTGQPDELNPDGSIRPQQVDASKIIPRLVGAVKELLTQVETLVARVTSLEEQLGL